ncbi:MAG: DUF6029 family protein [Bacteroidales bacterium]|nr:DUF6029 family protein [Bacteroidales bacterium]
MSRDHLFILVFFLLIFSFVANAQTKLGNGQISGDFSFNGMYYLPDSTISAAVADEKVRANTYLNILYTNGGFSAGARYEFYLFPLVDFEQIGYKGQGISYFFGEYKNDFLQVTAGTFYEQFGNGFALRAYEDRQLGIDNSLLGVRVKATPYKGIYLKGVWGIERKNFDSKYIERKDFVRGLDAEVSFTDLIPSMSEKGFSASIGGSFVSKFEKADDPVLILPQNVALWAARMQFGYKGLRLEAEYANKINDPNFTNGYIYKNGDAFLATLSYSMKGLGVSASFIRSDNMDFRSQREIASSANLLAINNIPAIAKQYSYQLLGNYVYASQPNGQIGAQFQLNYQIPKKTRVGGKYGTDISFNFSRFHETDKQWIPLADSVESYKGTDGYKSKFFKFGKNLLYQDIGIELSRKFDAHWKLALAYNYIIYNMEILQGHAGQPMFHGHNVAADLLYKINQKHALRLEVQHLYSKQDAGSWLYAMLEYSISPHWFFSIGDQWNYGNADKKKRVHYFNFSASYLIKTTRISLNYGKTKEGMLCVGGVCREVSAAYGVGLSITTSF